MERGGLSWLLVGIAVATIGRLLIGSRPSTGSAGFDCNLCNVPGDVYYWLHRLDPTMLGGIDSTAVAAVVGIGVVLLAGVWGITRFVAR